MDRLRAGADRVLLRIPGGARQAHATIAGGGHFLRGEELARVVAGVVASS